MEPAVTALATIASIIAGSMMDAIDISRLEPSPPKHTRSIKTGQGKKKPAKREEIHNRDDVSNPMEGNRHDKDRDEKCNHQS